MRAASDRLSGFVGRAEGLRRVLDHDPILGERAHLRHVARQPAEMHRNDGPHIRLRVDRPLQGRRRHTERVRIDIDKADLRAGVAQAVGRRRERDRGGKPAITRTDAGGETGEVQRRRPVADRDRVPGADALGERRLEPLDRRALGEKIALQHRDHGVDIAPVDALAPIAEEATHQWASTSSRSRSTVNHRSLVLLAYSKSSATGRPCFPP